MKLLFHKFPLAADRQTRNVQSGSGAVFSVMCAGKTLEVLAQADCARDGEKDTQAHTVPKAALNLPA